MKWLLNLYPPAWQRRYRSEVEAHLEAHLATKPSRLRTALDIMAGAADAWLNPEWIPDSSTEGDRTMITASRQGPVDITIEAATRSGALMLSVCFILVAVGVVLDKTFGDHILSQALIYSSFFIAFTISTRHTFLQPYSNGARTALISAASVAWYSLFVVILAVGSMT